MVEFWHMIKTAMEDSGLSYQIVARRSGVGATTVSNLVRGMQRTTSVHNAVALCRTLKIPCEQLMQLRVEELEHDRE